MNLTDLKFQKVETDKKEVKEYQYRKREGHDLFVLLHGFRKKSEDLSSLAQTILDREEFRNASIIIPDLPFQFLSRSSPEIIARDIVWIIDDFVRDNWDNKLEKKKKIYLVGHSLGALIARKAYLYAYGEVKNENGIVMAPFESIIVEDTPKFDLKQRKQWVKNIDRIILLAGLNRGWSNNPASKWAIILGSDLAIFIDTFLYIITQQFLIFQMRRNTKFITNLRIQWVVLSNSLLNREEEEEVLTIQLLGTEDGQVSPEDNIDFITGRRFRYIEVKKASHYNIINLNESNERKSRFIRALNYDPNNLVEEDKIFLTIDDLDDLEFPKQNHDIKNVVFVIHGIRDRGFWTQRIAREIIKDANTEDNLDNNIREFNDQTRAFQFRTLAFLRGAESLGLSLLCAMLLLKWDAPDQTKKVRVWKTETGTYGYFGMIPFLTFYLRRNKVEWLMEQYVKNLAIYPNASFHYVGHSNGTYLLAKALEEYSCCHFNNIVFVGSVVSSKYNWQEKIESNQVKSILNFVATTDWIVGIFPNVFEKIPFFGWNKDLGGAGHKGFKFKIDETKSKINYGYPYEDGYSYETNHTQTINQLKYVDGGHGAALRTEHWPTIARFIVQGSDSLKELENNNCEKSLFKKERASISTILSQFNWLIVIIILLLVPTLIPFLFFIYLKINFLIHPPYLWSVFISISPLWILGLFFSFFNPGKFWKTIKKLFELLFEFLIKIILGLFIVLVALIILIFIYGVFLTIVQLLKAPYYWLICELWHLPVCSGQASTETIVYISITITILATMYLKVLWQLLTRI